MRKKISKKPSYKKNHEEKIVIDEDKGLVFTSEEELFKHFEKDIQILEAAYFDQRSKSDISVEDFPEYEDCLTTILADPDEIWVDRKVLPGKEVSNFIAEFEEEPDGDEKTKNKFYYVAQVFINNNVPTFVYMHFPTNDEALLAHLRSGERIYDRSHLEIPLGAFEGDALSEKEPLATGLYDAMLKLRAESDIPEEDFSEYFEMREPTIEQPDEIWRGTDSYGNILVNFIKEYPAGENEGDDVFYIAVTQEDPQTESHLLLFSFPTKDKSLLERYRHGENMHADEVTQEPSH